MKSVRRKVFLTIGITALAVVGFGVLSANVSHAFIAGMLFSGAIGGIALMGISCPKCSHTVLYREQRAFGSTFKAFSPFPIPEVCPNCGQRL
jgi:DNA-directed RNA polymerase subunit RPC12/RpoP